MARLTLVRHTRPDVEPGLCYGRMDVEVACSFDDEAQDALNRLHPPYLILSSPLQRCQRLAAFIADATNNSYTVDDRLREMDFGIWEGQLWQDIPRAELDAWAADFLNAAPHGGESIRMLNDRIGARLAEDSKGHQTTLWVTHAGVIKSAGYLLSGESPEFDWQHNVEFGHTLELNLMGT